MLSSTKKPFAVAFNLAVPLFIIVYSLLFFRTNFLAKYIIASAVLLIAAFGVSQVQHNRLGRLLLSTVMLFNITYLLAEVSIYFLLSFGIIRPDVRFFFGGIEATNGRGIIYDSISGYRGVPGQHRYLSIDKGELEFDHQVKVNGQGWFSNREYTFKKKSPGIKRYIVLGDSYSSGAVVPTAWPDLMQNILAKNGNDSIELYNFSLDGVGLVNWYRTFMYEVVPKYEFDGLIIADSHEKIGVPDFDRSFFAGNSYDDATYCQAMDIVNEPVPVVFPKEKAFPATPVYSNEELEEIIKRYVKKTGSGISFRYQGIGPRFLPTLYGVADGLYKLLAFSENSQAYNKPYETYYALVDKPYKMEYFDARYKYGYMFKEMVSYCKSHDKEVLLLNIPDWKNTMNYVHGEQTIYRNEHHFLADYYNIKQFDGFELFKGKDEAFVNQRFYKYDKHWNQAGEELFTEKLVESGILPLVFSPTPPVPYSRVGECFYAQLSNAW